MFHHRGHGDHGGQPKSAQRHPENEPPPGVGGALATSGELLDWGAGTFRLWPKRKAKSEKRFLCPFLRVGPPCGTPLAIDPARGGRIIAVLSDFPLHKVVLRERAKHERSPSFPDGGREAGHVLGDASKRIEEETQAMLDYINDELVPVVRENSSKGLHVAADKLKDSATYLDTKKQNQG